MEQAMLLGAIRQGPHALKQLVNDMQHPWHDAGNLCAILC